MAATAAISKIYIELLTERSFDLKLGRKYEVDADQNN